MTELRLFNVARASLDELLLDYEDYLRQHGYSLWTKDSSEAIKVRKVACTMDDNENQYAPYSPWIVNNDPVVVANTIICLIHQANYYLIDKYRHSSVNLLPGEVIANG